MTRSEVRVIGYGGQGVITLSKMIAYAAVVDNKEAVQTEAYGPASRGGSCWAEVVLDDEEQIEYPRAILPNYYIILSQAGADRYGKKFCNKPEVISIIDPLTVDKWKVKKGKTYEIAAQQIAKEEFKVPVIANILLLGAFTELTGLISKKAAIETIKKFVPEKTYELNMRAFDRGIELAKEQKEKVSKENS
ncbi:MAG TPA: 2-oxoacid:acceptor oxidoreductase family protein [Candidatus Deferrimicrobium sp.]|nr:2-oxoacid:acceptor oxidoreductase family protein [Candidatus Deferrimicrobium sp.]